MVFTPAQIRSIRQSKMTAVLVPVSEKVRAGSVRVLRRCEVTRAMSRRPARRGRPLDVLAYIEARLDLDPMVYVVFNVQTDGPPVAALITIKAVRDLALEELTADDAKHCGAWTVAGLRASWTAEHPRSHLVRLMTFELGDSRDLPRLLTNTRMMRWGPGKRGGQPVGDFTSNGGLTTVGEAEPVSRGEQMRYAAAAQQRYQRFLADRASELAMSPASERLVAIQKGTLA